MRVALGTIDVSDEERAAISFYYGSRATRQVCRDYIIRNGTESIVDQMNAMTEADWNKWMP